MRMLIIKAMAPHSSTLAWKIPWMEVHDTVQERGIRTISMERKCKKNKMAVWGGLTNSCEKGSKKHRRKGKI